MTFEGGVYGEATTEQRRAFVHKAGERVVEVAEQIRAAGIPINIVSMGSSPSAKLAMEVKGVTEVRPGTYAFYDANHVRLGIVSEDEVAATVQATVVSHAAADRAVVDAGSKALTQDLAVLGQPGLGLVKGMPGWLLDHATEEHGMLVKVADAPDLKIGQRLELIVNHVCPAVNLYDQMFVARDGEVVDTWPIAARGKMQ